MEDLRFEWSAMKNIINKRKHGVSFEDASTVFYDDAGLLIDDPEHSQDEARFILLGRSRQAKILVICHCYRGSGSVIRINFCEKGYAQGNKNICSRRRKMRREYNFEGARENPYAKRLKKQITINVDNSTIDFFKHQATESGIPYQTLINLYLSDCARNQKRLQVSWE